MVCHSEDIISYLPTHALNTDTHANHSAAHSTSAYLAVDGKNTQPAAVGSTWPVHRRDRKAGGEIRQS